MKKKTVRKKQKSEKRNSSLIEVRDLSREFHMGTTVICAVKNMTFSFAEGEFIAITGRSGSGKSTLLYQMGALDHPTRGTVHIDGVNITALERKERTRFRLNKLGYVFQDYALLPELTAEENVMVPLMMQGCTPQSARVRAAKTLQRVGLGDRLQNRPAQLSGGQQQRVSIARAVAHNPRILFADEPTANLDSETATTILDLFSELHEAGQTIIMVTHEKEFTQRARRVLTLADGEIVTDKKVRRVQS